MYKEYSTVQLSNPNASKGESPIFRNADYQTFKPSKSVSTLYEVFESGLSIARKRPFLGTRHGDTYKWQTYSQVDEQRTLLGSFLCALFDASNGSKNVGIYAINRAEWVVGEQACNAYSLVTVALYDTLGSDSLEFIVNHAELSVILMSRDKVESVLKMAHKCPSLKVIVSMDKLEGAADAVLKKWAKDRGVRLLDYEEAFKEGKKRIMAHRPPKKDDLASIAYTSGTTGVPKGALITHRNYSVALEAFEEAQLVLREDDTHISYLPLAHVFERVVQILAIGNGARIGFYSGDVEDMQVLKPTLFPSVPRLFNRIYSKIMAATLNAGGLRSFLFQRAVAAKLDNLVNKKQLTHSLWDRLLFSKVSNVLGGKVRMMITASAPIASDVLQFLRVCFSCDILEAYGATESCGFGSVTFPGDYSAGHIGIPSSYCELKLVDVPEMGYRASDKPEPRGEVCIRGPFIFKGYFKAPDKTAEALDSEGWLHTGDIGKWTTAGRLCLIDRKKNIFKLAQGEYIAPEKLENVYANSKFVLQSFIHGDSLENSLVAVIVPDPEAILTALKEKVHASFPPITMNNYDAKVLAAIYKQYFSAIKEIIMKDLNVIAKQYKLNGIEYIKNIHVEAEQFSVDNNIYTPTFKLKRNEAQALYKEQIQKMYQEIKGDSCKSKI